MAARRAWSIIGSAIFFVIAPGCVAGVVPWWISHWQFEPSPLLLRIIGGGMILAGSVGLLDSFRRFAVEGLGTPAPVLPTRHLVVSGLYRYVRNPMYVGVVSSIVGQALLLGSLQLLVYGAGVWLACHLFVLLYEEPVLTATYGDEYRHYRETVPRWVPKV